MSTRKVRNGEIIAAIAGVVLFVSLFLPWYSVAGVPDNAPLSTGEGDVTMYAPIELDASGWESFAAIDIVLTLCAAFGVALLVLVMQQATPAMPLAIAGLGAWAGVLAIGLMLLRVAFPPGDGLSREWGLYLALAAAITLFIGCWRSLGDERLRRPDGSWSQPSDGELGAGVDVSPLRPPDAEGA